MGNGYINQNYLGSELTGEIIKGAYDIFNKLGYGYPEKVYQNALCIKFKELGHTIQREAYCKLEIDGNRVGYFYIDIVIDDKIAVELKARNEILDKDIAQILAYLKVNKLKVGLVLAFAKTGVEIKRLIL